MENYVYMFQFYLDKYFHIQLFKKVGQMDQFTKSNPYTQRYFE